MANRLKAYVRRTLLTAARDYATGNRRTPESTRSAIQDAMRGTDTGWWHDLIYTADMLQMAHRYRADIATALAEYRDATGESYVRREYGEPDRTAEDILGALMRRHAWSFDDYQNRDEPSFALLGLRFAVEWYTGEVGHDLCPDL